MRWGLVLGLALTSLSGAAQAALPPKYQRLREFQAILDTPAVANAFPDDQPIERIEYLSPDRFRAVSARCSMPIVIADDRGAPAMPGPRRFVVRVGKLVCVPRR